MSTVQATRVASNTSHLESQPLVINRDPATQKITRIILQRQARDGFVVGSIWGLFNGIGGGLGMAFIPPGFGAAFLLPVIPSSTIGSGAGGVVSRVVTHFFKTNPPSRKTQVVVGALGGAVTGAAIMAGACNAFLPDLSTGLQVIITSSVSGTTSLMCAVLSCFTGDNVGGLYAGVGTGSVIGFSIGLGLGYPVNMAGMGSVMGAMMGAWGSFAGTFDFSCCKSCISSNRDQIINVDA